jgi:hypothetical protein
MKRFRHEQAFMVQDADGEFVSYEDYERLQVEYKTLYRLLQSFENRFPDHIREVYGVGSND